MRLPPQVGLRIMPSLPHLTALLQAYWPIPVTMAGLLWAHLRYRSITASRRSAWRPITRTSLDRNYPTLD